MSLTYRGVTGDLITGYLHFLYACCYERDKYYANHPYSVLYPVHIYLFIDKHLSIPKLKEIVLAREIIKSVRLFGPPDRINKKTNGEFTVVIPCNYFHSR